MHILLIFLIYVIVKWLRGGYRSQPYRTQRIDIYVHVIHGPGGGESAPAPMAARAASQRNQRHPIKEIRNCTSTKPSR
jgi:hypothetical protein